MNLKEGTSSFRVRPESMTGEWGPVSEFTVFVDTLPPIITEPDCTPTIGDANVTISASGIVDDTSQTTDVSKLDWIKFRISKNDGSYTEYQYNLGGVIVSPILSHTFTISIESNTLLQWEIIAQDVIQNRTTVRGLNIFRGFDGQIDITHSYDLIYSGDTQIFIGHPGTTSPLIQTVDMLGTNKVINANEDLVPIIKTDDILRSESIIYTHEYALSLIRTMDILETNIPIRSSGLEFIKTFDLSTTGRVIYTQDYIQIVNIVRTINVDGSIKLIKTEQLEGI